MEDKQRKNKLSNTNRLLLIGGIVCVVAVIFIYFNATETNQNSLDKIDNHEIIKDADDLDQIVDGIHVRTGFVDAPGLMAVVNNCTSCHSSQLVLQNKMNKERWTSTIRWMQKTQNLWELGDNEDIIINYLVTNYPPKKKGQKGCTYQYRMV